MMRVLFCELHKLFSSGIFIFIVLTAIALNFYLCCTATPVEVSDEQYKAFYCELDGLTNNEKVTKINAQINELYGAEITIETLNQRSFLQRELEQAELIAYYKDYLDEIDASAERMTSVSIFANKDSYAYKNIKSTPSAYSAVRDTSPVYTQSEGILLAVNNPACDIMLIFCTFTAVIVLIVRERESGIPTLIKPLRNGRAYLAIMKSAAILLCVIISGILLYGSALVVGMARFGFCDFGLPVQSLSGFIGCNLPINIGTVILLIFSVKIVAVFLSALIFECLCTAFFSIYAYILMAAITAVEILLYVVDGNYWLDVLGRINLAAFTQSIELFKTYLNINLFGEPYSLLLVTLCSLLIGTIAFFILQNVLFSHIVIKDFKTGHFSPTPRFIPKKPFSYAVYKQFITHKGLLLILFVLAVQGYLSANYSIEFNTDDMRYRAYCVQFSQMTEPQANTFAEAEKRRFEQLHQNLLTADFNEAIKIYDELNAESGFNRAYEQRCYIASLNIKNKSMFYQTGWQRLFSTDGYAEDMRLTLFAVLGVCLSVSPLIAYDNRRRLGCLLFTNLHGRYEYFRHNIIVSALESMLISIAVNAPHIIGLLSLYKSTGAEYSIRCIPEFEFFFDIPIFAYVILLCIMRTIVLILCGWIILFISSKCNIVSVSLLISAAIFLLPVMLYLVGVDFILPLCVPFSVNREIIEKSWVYLIALFIFLGCVVFSTYRKSVFKRRNALDFKCDDI